MKRVNIYTTLSFLFLTILAIWIIDLDCRVCYSLIGIWFKILATGLVLFLGAIYFSHKFLKVEKMIFQIETQPLLETDEAVEGLPFAGQGIVESDYTLKAPYTGLECVYYHSIKEKKSGRNWYIVENKASFAPFYIRDKRGILKIDLHDLDTDFSGFKLNLPKRQVPDPKNSEIDGELVLRKERRDEPIIKIFNISLLKEKYRVTEFILKPKTKVFVYGKIKKKNGELILGEDKDHPLIISKKNRDQYIEEFYQGDSLLYFRHILMALGFTLIIFALRFFLKFDEIISHFLIVFGNLIILGSLLITIYNRIVTLRNRALNSLSNIEIELARRSELIPKILAVVKKLISYENLQKIIAEERKKIIFSDNPLEEKEKLIPLLIGLAEDNPRLQSAENFKELMRTLIDTEERIAYSREFYNRNVRKYNILIKQFPFLILALIFRFKEMKFIRV